MITLNREVMGGVPCVRNTRIPVVTILNELAAREDPLKLHSDLTPKDVADALDYAAKAVRAEEILLEREANAASILLEREAKRAAGGEVVYVRMGPLETVGIKRARFAEGFSENATHQPWMTRTEARRDAASRGMKAVFVGRGTCACGSFETTYEPNPYNHDLHGDSTRVWMCARCRELSAAEL